MIQIRLKLEPKTDCRSVKIIGIKNKIKLFMIKNKILPIVYYIWEVINTWKK